MDNIYNQLQLLTSSHHQSDSDLSTSIMNIDTELDDFIKSQTQENCSCKLPKLKLCFCSYSLCEKCPSCKKVVEKEKEKSNLNIDPLNDPASPGPSLPAGGQKSTNQNHPSETFMNLRDFMIDAGVGKSISRQARNKILHKERYCNCEKLDKLQLH